MKKYSTYRFLLPVVFAVLGTFTGCKKDDGPIKKDVFSQIDAVPAISTAIDPTGSQAINVLDLASFQGKFTVSQYFSGSTPPDKVDVVVRKNKSNTNVKVFKDAVTTFPSTFTVTAAQLQALFGTPVVLNDSYDFGADIYVNGKKYEAFPVTGIANGSGVVGMPGFSAVANFTAICQYDPSIYQGDFEVVSDGFEEFAPGDIITLTKVSNNQFSFYYNPPSATGPFNPAIVTVNTLNNLISIPKTNVGTKFYTYTKPNIQTDATAALSYVSPCDEKVTLSLTYTVDQGSFGGGWVLVLKKKH